MSSIQKSYYNFYKPTSKFLTFGNLNLTCTINLNSDDITNFDINFDDLNYLEDLTFLQNYSPLWEKVSLSSEDKTMNFVLQMNKISEQKNYIKYIIFKKIQFNDIQKNYIDFLSHITNENGLYFDSCNICQCQQNIELILTYNNNEKKFNLCEENDLSQENCSENPFMNISNDIYDPNDYNFIYFDITEYKNITISNLFEYCYYLKLNYKCKLFLNLKEEIRTSNTFKDLLSLMDICIYYSKNKLYEILSQLKYNEDKKDKKKLMLDFLYEKEQKQKQQEILLFQKEQRMKLLKKIANKYKMNSNRENKINIDNNKTKPTKIYSNSINIENYNTKYNFNKNNKTILNTPNRKKIYVKPISPKKLDKLYMFNYYKKGICDNDILKITDLNNSNNSNIINNNTVKLAIVLDELKKLYLVFCDPTKNKPKVLDIDLSIYPQNNIHNLKLISKYKNIVNSNYDKYMSLLISGLISIIVQKSKNEIEENSIFLGYLVGVSSVKKLLEFEKNNIPYPNTKDFFYPNIEKLTVEKLVEKAKKYEKENSFVLDCNDKNEEKFKQYNPLLDKHLISFFQANKNFLKTNGFITSNGEILYDPVYKEIKSPNFTKKNFKSLDSVKTEKICNKRNRFTLGKFLTGYNKKTPEYNIYLNTVKKSRKFQNIKMNNSKIRIQSLISSTYKDDKINDRSNSYESQNNNSNNKKFRNLKTLSTNFY